MHRFISVVTLFAILFAYVSLSFIILYVVCMQILSYLYLYLLFHFYSDFFVSFFVIVIDIEILVSRTSPRNGESSGSKWVVVGGQWVDGRWGERLPAANRQTINYDLYLY